jgi:acetoin utilization deacetylase AcuC-like enzyme
MIKVFYRPEQSCASNASYSPSAGKPEQVIADWSRFGDSINIDGNFNPATELDFIAAHDREYVMNILEGNAPNGFGNKSMEVAQSLRYTTGSMLEAADYAILNQTVACSPTSGFHHAGFDFGGGFCTFNGLMVTAIRMKMAHKAERVLIVDMDQHFGNGTQDIIDRMELDWVRHITNGQGYRTAEQALQCADLDAVIRSFKPDLILYQAGADIHVKDPLGGLLTTEQMAERDRLVFRSAMYHNVPLVWNLAGGYQRDKSGGIEPVLALHRQTMDICIQEYA